MRWLFGHWMPYESVYSTGSEIFVDLDRMHGTPYTYNEELSHGHQFVYTYTSSPSLFMIYMIDVSVGDIMYLDVSQYQVDKWLWADGWAPRATLRC